jgi:hypothetical protein
LGVGWWEGNVRFPEREEEERRRDLYSVQFKSGRWVSPNTGGSTRHGLGTYFSFVIYALGAWFTSSIKILELGI